MRAIGIRSGIPFLLLLLLAGPAAAGPPRQYRGPEGELPRGVRVPGADEEDLRPGRLAAAGGRVEGLARWQFWWETNRESFLRRDRAIPRVRTPFAASVNQPPAALSGEARRRVLTLLVPHLEAPSPVVREAAALSLAATGDLAALAPLARLLGSPHPGDRRVGALALGLLGDAGAAEPLLRVATDPGRSAGERAPAALALGLLAIPETAAALGAALTASFGASGHEVDDFQCAAATALGLLGRTEDLALLARLAAPSSHRSDVVRAAAASALSRSGSRAPVPALVALLGDGSAPVRRAAAESLGILADPAALDALLEALSGDGDLLVRNLAAIAVARTGGRRAREALEAALQRSRPLALREYAALALGLLGETRAADVLRELVASPEDAGLRAAAALALGLLRDDGSLPLLHTLALSATVDEELRAYVVEALALLDDDGVRPLLPSLAATAGAANLRRCSALALGLAPGPRMDHALLRLLVEDEDPFVRGAAASAFAFLPREAALDALTGIVDSPGFREDARLSALVALGAMARSGRRWGMTRLLGGLPFHALTPSLRYAHMVL